MPRTTQRESDLDAPRCLCGSRDFSLVRTGSFNFFPVDGKPVPFSVLTCRQCHLCVTSPRPGKHIAFLSDDSKRERPVETDSDMLAATSRYRLAKILSRVGQPETVLEIGCSTGALVEMLSQAGVSQSVGVELHAPAVAGALARGRHVLGKSLQECAFPSDHFDFVHAHHVLEHVPDLHDLLREVRRVLRPGGACYFTVPCFASPLARDDDWSGWFPQEHFWHFERDTLLPILAQHGFGQFRTARPMLTDHSSASSVLGLAKKLARSMVRELQLGDSLEVWGVRIS